MWFVILGRDTPDALARRLAARSEHLKRLEALRDAGRLLIADLTAQLGDRRL